MLIDEAIKTIVKEYQPEKIILFGSRATGEHRPDSDYDFIIVKKTNERWIRRSLAIPDVPIKADFFVYTPEEFEHMKDSSIFMVSALKDSVVVYDKEKKIWRKRSAGSDSYFSQHF